MSLKVLIYEDDRLVAVDLREENGCFYSRPAFSNCESLQSLTVARRDNKSLSDANQLRMW